MLKDVSHKFWYGSAHQTIRCLPVALCKLAFKKLEDSVLRWITSLYLHENILHVHCRKRFSLRPKDEG